MGCIMKTYRAQIRMTGSYISKLQSDTIFGGLCWAYKSVAGEKAFMEMLDCCKSGTPPFVVSDLFPANLLPRPLLRLTTATPDTASKKVLLENLNKAKIVKDINWLTFAEFQAIVTGKNIIPKAKQPTDKTVLTLHNTISRMTNTTLDEGGLYDLPETFSAVNSMTMYLRVKEGWENIVKESLELLGETGIGKRRSTGKGGFKVLSFEEFAGFPPLKNTNSFVSLSHFVPAPDDPQQGFYKTLIKYPKLDREYAISSNPFKYPLMLFVPGSTFLTQGRPRPYYGRAIQNIAPGLPSAIQGCFSFAVPARIEVNLV